MELKEVLHLYIGCEMQRGGIVTHELLKAANEAAFDAWQDFKPILRPLSDMTEEEIKDYFIIKGLDCENTIRANIEGNFIQIEYLSAGDLKSDFDICFQFTPKQTAYLLSRHFDLFGLIESGQAIDKTTIQH